MTFIIFLSLPHAKFKFWNYAKFQFIFGTRAQREKKMQSATESELYFVTKSPWHIRVAVRSVSHVRISRDVVTKIIFAMRENRREKLQDFIHKNCRHRSHVRAKLTRESDEWDARAFLLSERARKAQNWGKNPQMRHNLQTRVLVTSCHSNRKHVKKAFSVKN